jgi:hypothetical protein
MMRLGQSPRRHLCGTVTPSPAASVPVILHELAHLGVGGLGQGHGREFARLHLGLWRRFIGPEAGAMLLDAYRRNRVKHRAAPKGSAHRPGNPEALAAFRKPSDGEWIVAFELGEPDRERGGGWQGGYFSLSYPLGQPTRTGYVSNYARGEVLSVTATRRRATVWKTRATAERWAATFAAAEQHRGVGEWRVEAA